MLDFRGQAAIAVGRIGCKQRPSLREAGQTQVEIGAAVDCWEELSIHGERPAEDREKIENDKGADDNAVKWSGARQSVSPPLEARKESDSKDLKAFKTGRIGILRNREQVRQVTEICTLRS